jgi:hypothetical protein
MRGGRSSVRLVTSRRLDVATEAMIVPIGGMTPEEARQLLPIPALADGLANWPLALAAALQADRVRRGEDPQQAARWLTSAFERKGLGLLSELTAAIRKSLEALPPHTRHRLTSLAQMGKRAAPLGEVSDQWGVDDFETEDTLHELERASLVSVDLRSRTVEIRQQSGRHARLAR